MFTGCLIRISARSRPILTELFRSFSQSPMMQIPWEYLGKATIVPFKFFQIYPSSCHLTPGDDNVCGAEQWFISCFPADTLLLGFQSQCLSCGAGIYSLGSGTSSLTRRTVCPCKQLPILPHHRDYRYEVVNWLSVFFEILLSRHNSCCMPVAVFAVRMKIFILSSVEWIIF